MTFIVVLLFTVLYFIYKLLKVTIFRKYLGEKNLSIGYKKLPPREDIDFTYIEEEEEKDYLLRDFFIASAYRPYQLLGEHNGICSYESIKLAIEKGARFHFIDIWSSEENIPVVRNEHMFMYSKPLEFDKICEIYSIESWKNNIHDPLLLYLNIRDEDKEMQDKIADSINTFFKNKKYSGVNISKVPIKDIVNKVIIITNIEPQSELLRNITNAVINSETSDIGRITYITHRQKRVKSIKIDSDEFKYFNRKNLGLLIPKTKKSLVTFFYPKDDIYNISCIEPMNVYGFNIVPINYQLSDIYRDNHIQFFKKRGFKLKPKHLRYTEDKKFLFEEVLPEVTYKPRCKKYPFLKNKICI